MSRALSKLGVVVNLANDVYRQSALCRGLVIGLGLLFGLLSFDLVTGSPMGLRMAYVLPLWIATKRGGREAGACLVIATTFGLAWMDTSIPHSANLLANFAIQTCVLYGLMLIFHSVESRLRDVTTMATRDALTGLSNRFALEERAKKAIDRALLVKQPLAFTMLDCDRFKELNDQFGHAYGDQVLRLLSKSLRRSIPVDAIVGRTGGDEFIIIMPNRDRLQALSVLEAALDRFMSHTEIIGRSSGFSYGIAMVAEDGIAYERLVDAADHDMYRRKANRASRAVIIAS